LKTGVSFPTADRIHDAAVPDGGLGKLKKPAVIAQPYRNGSSAPRWTIKETLASRVPRHKLLSKNGNIASEFTDTLRVERSIAAWTATMRRFWTHQCGSTAIEYDLLAAGIALVMISVVNGIAR
jgi:hypothetical protein